MSAGMKMTKQGVRDLDFGWKKAVAVPAVAADDQSAAPEATAAVEAGSDDAVVASPESAQGSRT